MQCEMCNENLDSKLNLTQKGKSEETGEIVIDWQEDWYDYGGGPFVCYGAMIYKDGEVLLDRHPDAHKDYDYTPEEIIHDLLVKLGYKVRYAERNPLN